MATAVAPVPHDNVSPSTPRSKVRIAKFSESMKLAMNSSEASPRRLFTMLKKFTNSEFGKAVKCTNFLSR